MFEFIIWRPSPRRTVLYLGEDMGLPQEEKGSSPRRRKCSPKRKGAPRRGNVLLGEPKDGFRGVSCSDPQARPDPIGGSEPKPPKRPAEAINKICLSNTFHSRIFAEDI